MHSMTRQATILIIFLITHWMSGYLSTQILWLLLSLLACNKYVHYISLFAGGVGFLLFNNDNTSNRRTKKSMKKIKQPHRIYYCSVTVDFVWQFQSRTSIPNPDQTIEKLRPSKPLIIVGWLHKNCRLCLSIYQCSSIHV